VTTGSGGAFEELGRILSKAELRKLIAAFDMGQSCGLAVKQLSGAKAQAVGRLLDEAGLAEAAASLRSGLCRAVLAAREDSQAEIETVWTMPALAQVAGLRTSAMFHEIGKAKESIVASTFNVQLNSGMVQSLRAAAIRGVAVTLMATPGGLFGPANGMTQLGIQLSHEIPGCRLLTLADAADGSYQVLHSKFVVVDSKWAFVGSANFSNAASSKNVELGLQVHSETLARKILRDVQAFETQGLLTSVV
jgi:phosphatidylserine/phosphatidylglycerophosphate/cardiolipin synthase-like enzyme